MADGQLLMNDANERSISHRLAIYIETHFPSWNVDCEYNRSHDDPKRLNIPSRDTSSDDLHARTVYPDIIVHRRNTDDNLLVVEIKKTTSIEDDGYDLGKLRAFKSELGYEFAVFIKLQTDGQSGYEELRFI